MKRGSRLAVLGLALAGLAVAAPFTYQVVQGDGTPGGFVGQVDAAFKAWADVRGTSLSVQGVTGAPVSFGWGGDGVDLNPDEITRSTVSVDGGNVDTSTPRPVEVRVNPAYATPSPDRPDLDSALRLEAGQRLGIAVNRALSGRFSLGEAEAKLVRTRYSVTGDLNGDGQVDVDDLALLAANYGKRSGAGNPNLSGDLNADGVVDDKDLELMKANYSFDLPAAPAPAAPTTTGTPASSPTTPTPGPATGTPTTTPPATTPGTPTTTPPVTTPPVTTPPVTTPPTPTPPTTPMPPTPTPPPTTPPK